MALIYGEDRCKCLLKSEQMDRLFDQLFIMPFENIERLKSWLAEKLGEAFPKMNFMVENKGSFVVDLKASAFQLQVAKISIKYENDDKGHLFITKCGWAQGKVGCTIPEKETEHICGK